MNDRGIWATWYDLPEKGREQHLAWLHGTYIPKILKRPGVLWGAHYANAKIPPHSRLNHTEDKSVPTGNDFILLFGGETAHAFTGGWEHFAKGGPDKREADLTAEDREMLKMRVGERVCVFTEEGRADGPEAHRRGGKLTPAACIQLGSFNAPGCEDELMSWYGDWRIPALGRLPGCVGIRKLVSVIGRGEARRALRVRLARSARSQHAEAALGVQGRRRVEQPLRAASAARAELTGGGHPAVAAGLND